METRLRTAARSNLLLNEPDASAPSTVESRQRKTVTVRRSGAHASGSAYQFIMAYIQKYRRVMYCVNGKPRSSLLIESTDSMILILILQSTYRDSVVSFDARLHVHPIHFLARRAVC